MRRRLDATASLLTLLCAGRLHAAEPEAVDSGCTSAFMAELARLTALEDASPSDMKRQDHMLSCDAAGDVRLHGIDGQTRHIARGDLDDEELARVTALILAESMGALAEVRPASAPAIARPAPPPSAPLITAPASPGAPNVHRDIDWRLGLKVGHLWGQDMNLTALALYGSIGRRVLTYASAGYESGSTRRWIGAVHGHIFHAGAGLGLRRPDLTGAFSGVMGIHLQHVTLQGAASPAVAASSTLAGWCVTPFARAARELSLGSNFTVDLGVEARWVTRRMTAQVAQDEPVTFVGWQALIDVSVAWRKSQKL